MIPEIGKEKYMGTFIRPNDDISPRKKNKPEYLRAWAEYIYSKFQRRETTVFFDAAQIHMQRQYAEGRQDWRQYLRMLGGSEGDEEQRTSVVDNLRDRDDVDYKRKHYMAVNFRNIVSIAPKIENYAISNLLSSKHKATIRAIDQYATDMRTREKWGQWAKSQSRPFVEAIQKEMGMPVDSINEVLPQTMEELNFYESIKGFPLSYEIGIEAGLEYTDEYSDIERVREKVYIDLFRSNCGAMVTEVDPNTQRAKYRYVDFADVIIKYSRETDFENALYAAVPSYKTISYVRSAIPEITNEELRDIVGTNVGKWGNASKYDFVYDNNTETWDYDDCLVPVLECWWKTTDTDYNEYEINPDKVRQSEVDRGKLIEDNGRYYKRKDKLGVKECVYGVNWIIGTKHIYCGGRKKDDMGELPIQVYYIRGKSKVDLMIPFLDNMAKTYFKMEDAIAKAMPPGFIIDIEGLANVKFGKKLQHPLTLMQIATQTGNIIYSSKSGKSNVPGMPDKVQSRKMIEPHAGSGTDSVLMAIQAFEANFNWISELTGIDRTAQVRGQQDTSKTATEIRVSAEGSMTSLMPLERAWLHMYRKAMNTAARYIEIKVWDTLPDGKGYKGILGKGYIEAIRQASRKAPLNLGIIIKPLPSEAERNMLIQKIREAEANGFIPPQTGLYITRDILQGAGLEGAIALLNYEVNKAKAEAIQAQQKAQLTDRETQSEIARQKAEQEADIANDRHDKEIEKIRVENQEKRKTLELEYKLKKELEKIVVNKLN